MEGRSALDAARWPVDALKTGTCWVMRNSEHAEIVKVGSDVVVSIRWQLYDSASAVAARTQVDGGCDAA
jgi:hypothetical protein